MSRERDVQPVREAADAKLAKLSSDTDDVVDLHKLQAVLDVSIQQLTTELTRVNAHLGQVTAENLKLCTKPGAVAADFDKSLEEMAPVCGVRNLRVFRRRKEKKERCMYVAAECFRCGGLV